MSTIFNSTGEKKVPLSQPKIGQENLPSLQTIRAQLGKKRSTKLGKDSFFIFLVLFTFSSFCCSSKPPASTLFRDPVDPPKVVQETFAKEGKSDYFLLSDEGYSFRLIYLCENRVLNFIEEPPRNPILVSIQPILDTPVENGLSPDDRRRIWACMERKVWEEKSRFEELKSRLVRERVQLEKELHLELGSQHPLFGKKLHALARRQDRDYVLFVSREEPEVIAVVHITWSGHQELLPYYPWTTLFESMEAGIANGMRVDHEKFLP